jgi:hypothetical protein
MCFQKQNLGSRAKEMRAEIGPSPFGKLRAGSSILSHSGRGEDAKSGRCRLAGGGVLS